MKTHTFSILIFCIILWAAVLLSVAKKENEESSYEEEESAEGKENAEEEDEEEGNAEVTTERPNILEKIKEGGQQLLEQAEHIGEMLMVMLEFAIP
ncbi:unnamed protein product [Orchesella dallaii]|uniref:Uncharacterized protein n=1 Tax=Orchesella dallaii TaxID=48710 RepID=A0ABP1Q6R8_9HEXA